MFETKGASSRFFFVRRSPHGSLTLLSGSSDRVCLWTIDRLAAKMVDPGLTEWLIEKAYLMELEGRSVIGAGKYPHRTCQHTWIVAQAADGRAQQPNRWAQIELNWVVSELRNTPQGSVTGCHI